MPLFFTVLPNGRGVPAGARSQAFLLIDNWDDWFTYSTMYSLIVYDAHGDLRVRSRISSERCSS